jgi:large subunit ribosomal protein L19
MAEKKATLAEEVTDKDMELKPGLTVRVHQKIKELNSKGEEKERIQYFEGIIIARKHNKEIGATITVRKVSDGIGVEKIFPLNLPTITKVEVKKKAEVRRAKLTFLKKPGKTKKLKETVVR